MIEIILFILIILLFILQPVKKSIIVFVLLLPFNTFIKSTISYFSGGGELFAFWKEIAVLILFIKLFINNKINIIKNYKYLIIYFFFILVFSYFIISPNHYYSLAALRNHIFPLLLFITMANIEIDNNILKRLIIVFIMGFLINSFIGLIQQYFLKLEIAQLMGRIYSINPSGYIKYKTTSARILGYERMTGIMGGPNDFGLYLSCGIIFLFGIIIHLPIIKKLSKYKRFAFTTLLLLSFCILMSFSRAGWFLAFAGVSILTIKNNLIFKTKRQRYYLIILICFLFIIYYNLDLVKYIFTSTISGEELSAAYRFDNVSRGLKNVLNKPFGHGLGVTDNRYPIVEFFSESAFINILYEIGIFGFIILFLINILIIFDLKGNSNNMFSDIGISLSISAMITSFLSINTYGMPFIYLWWLINGLGVNKSIQL